MPFFENAKDFKIAGGEMNDISGNYTKNISNNNTTNKDSGNVNVASNVSQGNTKTQTATTGALLTISLIIVLIDRIGSGGNNAITMS